MTMDNFLNGFAEIDVKEIEKTMDCKSARKRAENAIELFNLRQGIDANLTHKKGKNSVIVKNLTELREFLNGKKEFTICKQDVKLLDGIYSIEEIQGRISYYIDNKTRARVYGMETIGKKDSKGRKLEFFLSFELNPQGFRLKKE